MHVPCLAGRNAGRGRRVPTPPHGARSRRKRPLSPPVRRWAGRPEHGRGQGGKRQPARHVVRSRPARAGMGASMSFGRPLPVMTSTSRRPCAPRVQHEGDQRGMRLGQRHAMRSIRALRPELAALEPCPNVPKSIRSGSRGEALRQNPAEGRPTGGGRPPARPGRRGGGGLGADGGGALDGALARAPGRPARGGAARRCP
jgi:hypothetical protein